MKTQRSMTTGEQRLQSSPLGIRRLAEATGIPIRTRRVSKSDACDLIRDQAMSKSVTNEEIALAIINAEGILAMGKW